MPLCAPFLCGRSALHPPEIFSGAGRLLLPTIWALRPKPRVTFPTRGKSPKARQGLCPLNPLRGTLSLPLRQDPQPLMGFCHSKRPICHFERVGKPALFSPQVTPGVTPSTCQSVARQVRCLRGCRGPFYPQPIPLGHKAGGSKGARPPRRGSRDQEVPGESLVTFFS